MKKTLSFILLIISCSLNAQVGIHTNNPQQKVHVSGTTANVRVDGLNETNNTNNLGVGSTTRVFVDANGDLILGTVNDQPFQILVDSENYLDDVTDPTSLVNQTGVGNGYSRAGIPVAKTGASFTLTHNAIVEVNYSISWSLYDSSASPTKRLSDGRARVIQMGLYFVEGDYLSTTFVRYDLDNVIINGGLGCIDNCATGNPLYAGLIAINGQFFNTSNVFNVSNKTGEFQNYQNTGSDYVKLGPGTYTAMFAAQVAVGVTTGAGAAKMYIGNGKDELQIIAHYYE